MSAVDHPARTYPAYETQTRPTRIGIVPRVLAGPALVAKARPGI